jgi:FkbM family methyltransferase
MIVRLLRDNTFLNPIFRVFILGLVKISNRLKWVADRYRIYGDVHLQVEGVKFKIYSEGDDFIANDIYYGFEYEAIEFKLVKVLTKRVNYFVDIGANTGIFSIFCSCSNASSKVIAFEPHPENYKRLVKNIELNSLSRIESYQLAVGNANEKISFTIPFDNSITPISSASEGFTKNFSSIQFKNIEVKQISLDQFLSSYSLSSIDLIKIDVEYYEYEVLQGALEILSSKKPLLLLEILNYDKLIEQFPKMENTLDSNYANRLESLLSSIGYYAYQLKPEGVEFVDAIAHAQGSRNFLFAAKLVPGRLVLYSQIAENFSF